MWQKGTTRLVLLLALGIALPATASELVKRLRVMMHPSTGAAGSLAPDTLTRLEMLTGLPLTLGGVTRTGSLEFVLPEPLDSETADAMARRLRSDRSVLWAEPVRTAPTAKSASVAEGATISGNKLMVRLTGDASPEWGSLLPRFGSLIGTPISVERAIGAVWVLKIAEPVPDAELAGMAAQLETDPAVQFADPVRRAVIKRVPNDPSYPKQWALSDPVGGINAPTAWDIDTGSAAITVAVIDTGITSHPELSGRVLPGFDFIRRTSDASDPGDATGEGECFPGSPAEFSSWHGTFVSGLIAANTDNGAGIAGMDWNAKILPVRVLGKCGGTFDGIVEGVLWAAGLPIAGVPANQNPAKVINMSIGGFTACPEALQDAVNQALAQGVVIAVAAGNESTDAASSAPADCSGVMSVGASTRKGERTLYSNFSRRIDISAPGGDGNEESTLITSISNAGLTSPGNPSYASEAGTSFAAPLVAGTASLILARNANLTPGQVQGIITGTARNFATGSTCAFALTCGDGLLDAGLAVQSTVPASATAPPGTVAIVEYYRRDKDHYFMTGDSAEAAFIDAVYSATFQRTGGVFYAWLYRGLAPASAQPVCRFYSPLPLIDSHFYTAIASECQFVQNRWPGTWVLEQADAFYVLLPDATGNCPPGTLPVYRFFNNRNDANHRYTIDLTARRAMLNRQWAPEGIGSNAVAFCSPI